MELKESEEKDYVLAQLADQTPPHAVTGLLKHADELEADGNINILSSENGFIIRALITDKGVRFLESGGYSKFHRKKLMQKFWYGFWFIMGVVATKITDKLIDIIFQQ